MTDRDPDRERRMRQAEDDSDWDWYYYEYRYEPYYSARNTDSGRNYDQDYRRNYGRAFNQDYGQDYGRSYNRGYGRNPEFDRDFSLYGVHPDPYWRRGQYSGMGPRGYRRSDERMQEDINDRLTWHGQVDASEVMVDVKDGIAKLTGTVNSRYEKRLAEDIAESIPGVVDVENNLKINSQRNWNRTESNTGKNQQTQGETTGTSRKNR